MDFEYVCLQCGHKFNLTENISDEEGDEIYYVTPCSCKTDQYDKIEQKHECKIQNSAPNPQICGN